MAPIFVQLHGRRAHNDTGDAATGKQLGHNVSANIQHAVLLFDVTPIKKCAP